MLFKKRYFGGIGQTISGIQPQENTHKFSNYSFLLPSEQVLRSGTTAFNFLSNWTYAFCGANLA